jgi:hypothetical protein
VLPIPERSEYEVGIKGLQGPGRLSERLKFRALEAIL